MERTESGEQDACPASSALEIDLRSGHHFEFFCPCFTSNGVITGHVTSLLQQRRFRGNLKVSCFSSFGVRTWASDRLAGKTAVAEGLTLQRFYDLGAEVAWCPYLQTNHILVDRKIGYTEEKENEGSFRAVPIDLLVSRLPSTQGFFRPFKGKVVLIQELSDTKTGEVDLFVRLAEENSQEKQNAGSRGTPHPLGSPVFLHSGWMSNQPEYGDTIRVSGIFNFSGEGIFGGYAPAELFYEGVSVAVLAEGNPPRRANRRRFKLRDEVENLINNDPRFSIESQHLSRKEGDEWVTCAFNDIKKIMDAQGLFVQPSDELFIMHKLNDRIHQRVTQVRHFRPVDVMKNLFARSQ